MTGKKRCEDWGLSSSTCPRQTTGTLRSLLRILAFPNSYFFLCPSVMAGGTSRLGWKAFLFSLQIATCVVDSSPSLSWYWGMSQNPGLFIFHVMCTLIGTLHRRDFLRKHWFSLLTTLLQTHFSPFLFPFCHRYDSFFYSFFFSFFPFFPGHEPIAWIFSNLCSGTRWNLISEAEQEKKSSTWGELWLMQKLKWWSRSCYYEDPEVFRDLLVERQKLELFSLERLLHIGARWGLCSAELCACLLSPFHASSTAAGLRARMKAACSEFKADQ